MLPSESDLVEPHVAAGSEATSPVYLCGMLRSFEVLPKDSHLIEPCVAVRSATTSQLYLCGMLRSFEVLPKHSDLIEPHAATESDSPSKVYLRGVVEASRSYLRVPTRSNLVLLLRVTRRQRCISLVCLNL